MMLCKLWRMELFPMLENYRNDPDPEKDKGYSLEECKAEWGLN